MSRIQDYIAGWIRENNIPPELLAALASVLMIYSVLKEKRVRASLEGRDPRLEFVYATKVLMMWLCIIGFVLLLLT